MADNSHLDAFAAKYGLSGGTPAPKVAQSIQKPEDPIKAFGKYLVDKTSASANSLQDGNEYSRVGTFDSSFKGAFKDRYKAYGQETYNRIGFDPFINNEQNFTSQTTTYDDAKRWLTSSALPMLGLGFMDPLNSYKDAVTGKMFEGNTDSAKDYEYYNMLGYSSRGGVGGFGVNLLNSFSYSAGVMVEGALEGMAIGAAVGAVGGEGVGAIPGAAIGGLIEGVSALTKIPRALWQTAKTIGKMSKAVKSLTAVNSAKNVWTAAKTGTVAVGKILNPLENTTEAMLNLSKWKDVDNLTGLARASRTAGAFWHDMMSMNMALSEGKLEGGMSELHQYEKLYNEYYAQFGKAPDEETQRDMVINAKEAGKMNTLANTGLVFYSNKLAFPSLTKAKFLKGLPSLNAGKVVGTVGKEFQLVVNNADDIAKASMEKIPINFRNSVKALVSPRKMGATAVNYFKANLVEGLQEVGQDALSSAVEDYYTKTFYDPSVKSYRLGATALAEGLSKQSIFSETFLSGFAMGSLLQGPGKLIKHGSRLGNRIFKTKENYDNYMKQKEEEADRIVTTFNNMVGENAKHLFNPAINSYANINILARNVDNPDKTTTKQLKDDSAATFGLSMLASIKNGTFDMYMDHIKNYKNATPEEIEEAWNLQKGEGQKALDNLDQAISNANTIKNRFEYAQNKHKPSLLKQKFKKGTEEYKKAEIYENAYFESLTSFVFLQSSFDDTLGRLNKLYGTLANIDTVSSSPFSNFAVLTNDANKLDREIEMLKTDIELGSKSSEPTTQAEVNDKRKLLRDLYEFQQVQNEMTEALRLARETGVNTDEMLKEMKAAGLDLHGNYSNAFLKILNTLAGSTENQMKLQDQIQKAGGFEEIYQALYDTHLLARDRNVLSDYVNLLNDPTEFMEHVNRNFKWMKNMYDNRKEYIKDIVNQEFKTAEQNEVLTELADKGIFVDLDKFADWVEDPRNIPDEFIDTTNNMIITENSVLYDQYAEIFVRAANAINKKPAGEPLTEKQKLTDRLEELKKEKNELVNKAREEYEQEFLNEYGRELSAVEAQNSRISSDIEEANKQIDDAEKEIKILSDLIDALNSNEAVTINNSVKKLIEDGVLSDEEFGKLITLDSSDPVVVAQVQSTVSKMNKKGATKEEILTAAASIIALPEFIGNKIAEFKELASELSKKSQELEDSRINIEETKSFKVYTEKIEQINKDFDVREQSIKDDFAEKGIDENTVDEITINTPYDQMPDELKAELDAAFDKFLEEIGDSASLKVGNLAEYESRRERWLESPESNARTIIKNYNDKAFAEARARAEKLKEPPFLKYSKKQVTSEDSVFALNQLYKQLKNLFETGKNADGKDVKLSAQQKADLKEDLQNLEGYLDAIAKTYKPKSVAQKVVNTIVERVINRRDEVEDVFDESGRKTRKFAGEEISGLKRVTEIATKIAEDKTGKSWQGYNRKQVIVDKFRDILENEKDPQKAVDSFMDMFKLLSKTYKVFNSKSKLERIEAELRKNPTIEGIEEIIEKYAFIESSEAGTKTDELIRKFLTLDSGNGEGFAEVKYSGTIDINGVEYKVSDFMSEKAFNRLFGTGGIVSSIRSKMIDGEFVLFPENLLVFDKTLGITGEIDLLAVNAEGEVMIIDIKTQKNWDSYESENSYNKVKHQAQLSIYATLFYNMTGIKPSKLQILPLGIEVTVDGYVTNIDKAQVTVRDSEGEPVKKDGKIVKKYLAAGYYELPFLDDLSEYGVNMIQPDFITELTEEDTDEEGTEESPIKEDVLEETDDLENITLGDLLNKTVMFNGSTGKLIMLEDGSFAVEKTNTKDTELLEKLLESLERDLEEETDPEIKALIQKSIINTKLDIKDSKQDKTIEVVYHKFKPATNGSLNSTELGISVITGITFPFQVSRINGRSIKAEFNDKDESIATINGVRYNVIRDKSGSIVALSYRKNEKAIVEIEQEIIELQNEIARINKIAKRENVKQKNKVTQLFVLNKVSELNDTIKKLEVEKQRLLDTNDLVIEKGSNTNDYIFALNALPNSFQKATKVFKAEDEKKHHKELDRLSLSAAVSKAITEIVAEEYPQTLDILFEVGVQGINLSELEYIYKWIDKTIEKLNGLGETIINRGDLVDDVSNQVNALLQLKNDLNLIKIIKDGKTKKPRFSKKQGPANKVFGTNQVQKRTNVSKNERSSGRQAETVPGLSKQGISTEELKELVNSTRTAKPTLTAVKKEKDQAENPELFEGIRKAKNKKELDEALQEALNNRGKVSAIPIQEAYKKREQELLNVSSDTIAKGTLLISKKPIFEGAENSVVEVIMMIKDSNQVVVKLYGTDTRKVFTEQEIKDNFTIYSKEAMEKNNVVEPVTEEQKSKAVISKSSITELGTNPELLNKAKEDAKKDSASRFSALKQASNNNNINNCD